MPETRKKLKARQLVPADVLVVLGAEVGVVILVPVLDVKRLAH